VDKDNHLLLPSALLYEQDTVQVQQLLIFLAYFSSHETSNLQASWCKVNEGSIFLASCTKVELNSMIGVGTERDLWPLSLTYRVFRLWNLPLGIGCWQEFGHLSETPYPLTKNWAEKECCLPYYTYPEWSHAELGKTEKWNLFWVKYHTFIVLIKI
jgi:hypothetical protein